MAVSKLQGREWFGAAMLARDHGGNTVLICRSIMASSVMAARLLIIRLSFERLKRQGVERLWCKAGGKKWLNPIAGNTVVDWRLHPVHEDINKLRESFEFLGIFTASHPLAREVKKLADKAAETRVSYSWP
ncbi:hypothetical protein COLO4_13195 [Corchorus olitorius]|uniref:Uncharacterized protein n=1 Tax=Corchorus olitorius TaxID=93759 RepID=A0A1R3JXT3_9ROSI|nr:hypothetical protein COLO4_13195 [Corchorus olitorius]